jgi:hypothetical protein
MSNSIIKKIGKHTWHYVKSEDIKDYEVIIDNHKFCCEVSQNTGWYYDQGELYDESTFDAWIGQMIYTDGLKDDDEDLIEYKFIVDNWPK